MYTVLVAENSVNTDGISRVLKSHFSQDCTIWKANNHRDIFRYISAYPIDILLLDMNMTGINQAETLHFLQEYRNPQVILPVVDLETLDDTLLKSCPFVIDYLMIPYSETELILTMEESLQYCKNLELQNASRFFPDKLEPSRMDIVKPRIQQYIQEHYRDGLSMQDVAKAMNYSDTHFCRLFKQCFQVNFSVYLNQFRVEQAKQLLAESDIAVKEVSSACGYRDTSYFIRVFKRHTGMTPSDYRIHKLTMTAKKSNKSQNNFIS